MKNAKGVQKTWSDTLVKSADSVMSLTSGLTSLTSIFSTLSNPDLSGWEKFTSVLMSLGMGIPMLISGFTGLKSAFTMMFPVLSANIA
jgi:hypothetical protein